MEAGKRKSRGTGGNWGSFPTFNPNFAINPFQSQHRFSNPFLSTLDDARQPTNFGLPVNRIEQCCASPRLLRPKLLASVVYKYEIKEKPFTELPEKDRALRPLPKAKKQHRRKRDIAG